MRAMQSTHHIMASIAPTCINAQAARVIDMILASTDGAEILKGVYTNSEYPEGPHKPVTCVFRKDASKCTRYVASKHVHMPTIIPFGPRTPPVDWGKANQPAEEALEAAKQGSLQ